MQNEEIMKELMLIKTLVIEIKQEQYRKNRVVETPAKMLALIYKVEAKHPKYVSTIAHSLDSQLAKGRQLSDKQMDTLINIYNGAKKWRL